MSDLGVAPRHEAVSARLRQKGDTLRSRGDLSGANEAYEGSLEALDRALDARSVALPTPQQDVILSNSSLDEAEKAADLLGSRGGLLRRLNREEEALQTYLAGAEIERKYSLKVTYNRLNAIKLSLLSGKATLRDEHPYLLELCDTLEKRLTTDEQAADDAWLWADLGDCRLLLGDTQGAEEAYRVFVQKAETRSPSTTFAVLRDIAQALLAADDPKAEQLKIALQRVEA